MVMGFEDKEQPITFKYNTKLIFNVLLRISTSDNQLKSELINPTA
jgi:hypothetical protein